MNYYERHLGDYARDTGHLSILEHGAYTLLLDRYYATEAGIPSDSVHRFARARSAEEIAAVDVVLADFFELVDGVWINRRAQEEIEKAQVKIAASKENGKKGGRPRKPAFERTQETQPKPIGFYVGLENETQPKPNTNPDETQGVTQSKANQKPNETQTKAHQTPVVNPLPSSSLRSEEGPSPSRSKSKASNFRDWLAGIRASGEKPVSGYQAVWQYAERAGLPEEWIELAWLRFRERYERDEKASRKRYTDWRKVFLNAVEGNWLGLWCWSDRDQAFRLTTAGMQAENVLRAPAA